MSAQEHPQRGHPRWGHLCPFLLLPLRRIGSAWDLFNSEGASPRVKLFIPTHRTYRFELPFWGIGGHFSEYHTS